MGMRLQTMRHKGLCCVRRLLLEAPVAFYAVGDALLFVPQPRLIPPALLNPSDPLCLLSDSLSESSGINPTARFST